MNFKTTPKPFSLLLLALLVVLPWSIPVVYGQEKQGANKELDSMDFKFCFDLAELQKPLLTLRSQYLEQLKSEKAELQQAGNLNAVLAYNKEVEILTKSEDGEPFDDPPDDPLVTKKRQDYQAQRQTLIVANFEKTIALSKGYSDKLKAAVVEKTRAGKLEDAQAFQARQEDLRMAVIAYRQAGAPGGELSPWAMETLKIFPPRPSAQLNGNPNAAKGVSPRPSTVTPGKSIAGTNAGETKQFEISRGLAIKFCWCPPGTFLMGSPPTEPGRENRENQVNVKISKGFWMGKYEVTQAQWRAVMGNNPSQFSGDNLPVENVSWNAAQEFVKKLNENMGIVVGWKVVLPTEAQWEYACRAGEKGPYSGGSIDEVSWYWKNSGGQTHQVGTKTPNPWGLHDMHGNVWEWCSNYYCSDLFGGVDPTGPTSGTHRVDRGGGGGSGAANYCRAAHRWFLTPSCQSPDVGFRVALVSTE